MSRDGNEVIRINTIKTPFDVVADRIMEKYEIFTTDGKDSIFVQVDEHYTPAKNFLDREIRNEFKRLFVDEWKKEFPLHSLPKHIPAAKKTDVKEVFAYIHAYRYISRQDAASDGMFSSMGWEK